MKRLRVVAPIVAIVVLAGLSLFIISSNNRVAVTHVKQVDLDHKTYSTIKELKEEADVVVRGTVKDSGRTMPAPSLRAADGVDIPSPPTTEFTVAIKKIIKGTLSKDEITVVLTGGIAGDTRYEAQDMPWLSKQQNVVLYLHLGDDGKYYPMAGGAAIATQKDKSSNFSLPKELSGASPIVLSETDL